MRRYRGLSGTHIQPIVSKRAGMQVKSYRPSPTECQVCCVVASESYPGAGCCIRIQGRNRVIRSTCLVSEPSSSRRDRPVSESLTRLVRSLAVRGQQSALLCERFQRPRAPPIIAITAAPWMVYRRPILSATGPEARAPTQAPKKNKALTAPRILLA